MRYSNIFVVKSKYHAIYYGLLLVFVNLKIKLTNASAFAKINLVDDLLV